MDGDVAGNRMALMAQAVQSDRELGDLLVWIDSLPALEGSSETGQGIEDLRAILARSSK